MFSENQLPTETPGIQEQPYHRGFYPDSSETDCKSGTEQGNYHSLVFLYGYVTRRMAHVILHFGQPFF